MEKYVYILWDFFFFLVFIKTQSLFFFSFLNSLFICLAKQVMETENNNLLKSSGHEYPFSLGNKRLHGYRVHHWVMTTFQNKVSVSICNNVNFKNSKL